MSQVPAISLQVSPQPQPPVYPSETASFPIAVNSTPQSTKPEISPGGLLNEISQTGTGLEEERKKKGKGKKGREEARQRRGTERHRAKVTV